jgi:ABC-type transport system involved in multi-copper enzyme maturation permease subunit
MPIFDQGYQHWEGPLSGHGWRWLAIAQHGVRVQLKNRILRLLFLVAWLPAIALIAAVAIWGLVEQGNQSVLPLVSFFPPAMLRDPVAYRGAAWTLFYFVFFGVQMWFIMLLVIIAGPGLISRDLRFNALPLYFARPMTRLDYFLGKLGVIAALVAAVAVAPAVFAYLVGVCFSGDTTVIKDTYHLLLGSIAYGLVITLSAGTLMLALSSLTPRSLYVGIAFAGIWIVSMSVSGIMNGIYQAHRFRTFAIENHDEMSKWLRDHPPPPGVQMHGNYPVIPAGRPPVEKIDQEAPDPKELEVQRWYAAYNDAQQKAMTDAQKRMQDRMAEEVRENWRPLCSYVANLNRLGDALLDSDSAWVAIGQANLKSRGGGSPMRGGRHGPPAEMVEGNDRMFADQMVPQYPWWWSAAVLGGLLGISTWTMTRQVKSLDRLK